MNKLTKGTALATAVCGLVISAPAAYARHDHDRDYDDGGWEYARVVSAEPIYHEVRVSEPREVCREEPVTERTEYRGGPDPGAILLGAAIGGVIGHQFGHGHGRDAATAAGAFIGGAHGAAASSRGNGRVVERTVYETSCHTVSDARYEDRIDGYRVTYQHHGRLYHTHLPYDPGRRMRVRVDVAPDYEDR
jgi:uncharacterized protein YcfJ